MRILHTSDWHLGKTLAGFSRAGEHEAFLDELVALSRDVDLVLVSGDVFDTYNPPIEAEELLYDALARLADGGRRQVVVIAGNHDSPERLAAPAPLCARHGIHLIGMPGAPDPLRLDLPCGERAVVAALPFPSDARLRTLLGSSRGAQETYADRVARAFAGLAAGFEPGAVNLAMSHLSVAHARFSESERVLVGGAGVVPASVLPAAAQYVALGHLHLPQEVQDAPTLARYAGAPLAFRMSERDYPRSHCIVEVRPGGRAAVELIPITSGRPLVRWEATGGMEEVIRSCEQGQHAGALIELLVHVPEPLDHTQLATLRSLGRDFVRIRAVLPQAQESSAPRPPDRRSIPADQLFRAFFRDQTGDEPDDGLVSLFLELASASRTDAPEVVEPEPAKAQAKAKAKAKAKARSAALPLSAADPVAGREPSSSAHLPPSRLLPGR